MYNSKSIKGASAVYCGFDPTAESLHAGNLLSIIALLHFRNNGIQPIALVNLKNRGIVKFCRLVALLDQ